MTFKPILVPLGDSALLIQLGEEIDITVNRSVHALTALLQAAPFRGLIETVPAYRTVLVHYDPLILTETEIRNRVLAKLDQVADMHAKKPRQLSVPVRYGGEYGVDLEFVAEYHRLHVEEVIRIHSEKIYTVYMMGFTPGFPYMGRLDDAIMTPRLETPRTRVPAGTVAIAGSQTGIYPIDSPGGWRLIGHTSVRLFDPEAEIPFLFSPGDEVKFIVES
jgi:KipI family sensor histidine kinase inhibitor